MDDPTIITDTLRVERSRHGKQRLVPSTQPVTLRGRNATSRQDQTDLRAALRYHVLKGITSGEYESLSTPAHILRVSKVWITRLMTASEPA